MKSAEQISADWAESVADVGKWQHPQPFKEEQALPLTPAVAAPTLRLHPTPAWRGFAGLSYAQLVVGALVVLAAIWGMWATSKIFALDDRRVVSVRLAAIVNDFVTSEARSGTPPEQLGVRTRVFMSALDGVLKKRAADGQVVLVGEAVVASSVPDVTKEVVADLAKVVSLAPPAATPPALLPVAPRHSLATPSRTPMPAPPAADPAANPFGAPSAPSDTASGQ